jgi:hypothetical protein
MLSSGGAWRGVLVWLDMTKMHRFLQKKMPGHIYIRSDNREYGLLHTMQI